MEIVKWSAGRSVEGTRGQMVRVTRGEALMLIESLSRQLRTGNANDDRAEFTAGVAGTKAEEYFSIVVAEQGGAAQRNAKGKRRRKVG